MKEQVKEARAKQVDAIGNEFLSKAISGQLSVGEIMNSNLPATGEKSKDFWLKKLSSEDNIGNPYTYNKTFSDVANYTEEQLFDLANPVITNTPISNKQLESLLKAKRGETDNVLKNYFEGTKSTFTSTNPMMGIKDPDGDTTFMSLKFEAEKMVSNTRVKGTKEYGLNPSDLFDPSSPRYNEFGGALINKYKKSPNQIMESMTKQLNSLTPTTEPKKPINDRVKELLNK